MAVQSNIGHCIQIKTHISIPLIGFYHIIYQNLKYLQTLVNSSDFQLEHSEKHPNFLQGFVCFKYKLKDDKCWIFFYVYISDHMLNTLLCAYIGYQSIFLLI